MMTPEQTRLRERLGELTPEEFHRIATEVELGEWRAVNKFCGKCGTAMVPHADPNEHAFTCPACGYLAYPKISPAVIVLVTKGRQILLQRNSHYRVANWTLVAGFVDPGENFEEAVRREAREEASIKLTNIRYARSQAWPFPSNIMVGFRAEWAGGDLTPDGEEVIESAWFDVDHLPAIPRAGSIARKLIDDWIAEQSPNRTI
ncbi:MAG: NAD(+) diphosphatase [Kiritimatiellae bacterium]|nr:NAD(+) diphosphatase [Kiritimatiellia bacterium]